MLNTFRKNTFLKITSFNSISVFVKLITSVLVSKIFALFLGPKGFALIGNLRDFISLLSNIGPASIQKGIIREASKNRNNPKLIGSLLRTILLASLSISIIQFIGITIFSDLIAQKILRNIDYGFIIISIGIISPFSVFHVVIQSIINGVGNYSKVILVNILINILNPIVIYLLTIRYNIKGALLAISLMPLLFFIITLIINYKYLKPYLFTSSTFSYDILKKLRNYVIMYIPSAIMFPILYIFIRNYITTNLGVTNAGYYEAMQRVSQNYMLFANSLLSLYLLPEMVQVNKRKEIITSILKFCKNFLPLFVLGLILIFIFKNIIISILYSKDFESISSLFKWQLLGDFFRFISLTLVVVFHANKMILTYIFTDIVLFLLLGIFSVYFISFWGIEGSIIAHFITYLIYFIIVLLTLIFHFKSDYNFTK